MKKKTLVTFTALVGLLGLSSCDLLGSSALINSEDNTSSSTSSVDNGGSEGETSSTAEDNSDFAGFTKMKLKDTLQGFNRFYSEATGEQNILIVPIHLAEDSSLGNNAYSGTWTDDVLEQVSDSIFDTTDPESLASYYNQASFGQLTIGGEVSELYNSSYTTSELTDDYDMTKIFQMFSNAVEWINENDSTIDIANDYDKNDDGYIDNVHFIIDGNDFDDWGSTIWPHQYSTEYEPAESGELPNVHSYSLSNLGHLSDAYTTIHEQGHIFGLQDYYNYSEIESNSYFYGYIDYIGGADMQDLGMFDWNAYSKMSVGWIEPYYFDDTQESATITIKPSGTSGDAIVLGQGWNGTAFDEYITLELFTEAGNNQYGWSDEYPSLTGQQLGNGGVRVSHVDSRVATYLGGDSLKAVDDYVTSDYDNYYLRYSNSYDSDDYNGYTFDNNNYHLLEVIQAGGVNEFGKVHNYYNSNDLKKTYLSEDDLFQTGDTFSMAKYGSEFFYNKTKLNNGNEFPYVISFDSVTAESATITITRI